MQILNLSGEIQIQRFNRLYKYRIVFTFALLNWLQLQYILRTGCLCVTHIVIIATTSRLFLDSTYYFQRDFQTPPSRDEQVTLVSLAEESEYLYHIPNTNQASAGYLGTVCEIENNIIGVSVLVHHHVRFFSEFLKY